MTRHKAIGFGATLVGLAAGGNAMAAITMDKDVDNTPFVLIGGAGYYPELPTLTKLGITNDGYVVGYDYYQSGYELHVLSPSLKKRNDVTGTANHSQYAVSQIWKNTQEVYAGSVSGGSKNTYSYFMAGGMARNMADDTMLSWVGGGSPNIYQTQFQNSSGNYAVQQLALLASRDGLAVGTPTAPIAMQHSKTSVALGAGQHRSDLDYVATSGSNFQMLGAFGTNGGGRGDFDTSNGILKMEWSRGAAGTSTTVGTLNATASGTARFLVDGSNSKSNLLTNLVPSISDGIRGMAMDPVIHAGKNRLYFVSVTNGANDINNPSPNPDFVYSDNQVYLSAVEFNFGDLTANSVATYVDLDPLTLNNYLEITWKPTGYTDNGTETSANGSLLAVRDLVFSPDGSKIYVSNDYNRVFMFTVPEPSSMGLLGVGALAFLRRKRIVRSKMA